MILISVSGARRRFESRSDATEMWLRVEITLVNIDPFMQREEKLAQVFL
jgi:hypothetical protein